VAAVRSQASVPPRIGSTCVNVPHQITVSTRLGSAANRSSVMKSLARKPRRLTSGPYAHGEVGFRAADGVGPWLAVRWRQGSRPTSPWRTWDSTLYSDEITHKVPHIHHPAPPGDHRYNGRGGGDAIRSRSRRGVRAGL